MPDTTNNSRAPPTGAWRAILLTLAKIGGRGAALERWALKQLGVWADEPPTLDGGR